jgi:hypothetical protein
MHAFVVGFIVFRKFSQKTWLFNLDCHVSVIADLKQGLQSFPEVRLVSWSLSGHNFVFRKWFKFPDPVMFVGAKSWKRLDSAQKSKFLRVYRRFLSLFDGFVVTFPPAFLTLFSDIGKPILVIVAIRYEHPFSARPEQWAELDASIVDLIDRKQLTVAANNHGDADYFVNVTGQSLNLVPSVCDYIPAREVEPGRQKLFPIFAKSQELAAHIQKAAGFPWMPKGELFGAHHSWESVMEFGAVIYIPYNTSTMTLFELATLGTPVLIPDRQLLKKLRAKFEGVLSELTFAEMENVNLHKSIPRFAGLSIESPGYLDWWLDRADFYNPDLMPNVLQFSSFDEEVFGRDFHSEKTRLAPLVALRNQRLLNARHTLLAEFVQGLGARKNGGTFNG